MCISPRITAYKLNYFHQWESFMLTWHISLNGCHGNDSPFGERLCSRNGIFSDTQMYSVLSTAVDVGFLLVLQALGILTGEDGWLDGLLSSHTPLFSISFFFFYFFWTEATCFWIKSRTQQLHSHTVDTVRSASTETEWASVLGGVSVMWGSLKCFTSRSQKVFEHRFVPLFSATDPVP